MEKNRKIFLNRRTIMHMLETRGYDVKDPKRNYENYEKFVEKFSEFINENDLEGLKEKISKIYYSSDNSKSIYVWFSTMKPGTKSTGKDIVLKFLEDIKENECDSGIIILEAKFASEAGKDFENARKTNPRLQFFLEEDLYSTVINHVLVPKHELIPPKEKEKLIKEMKLPHPENMEFILSTDPVVKFYGWLPGDMIRIHRNDDFVDTLTPLTYGYRIVKKAM